MVRDLLPLTSVIRHYAAECLVVGIILVASSAAAESVRVRYPEGATLGFVNLATTQDIVIAHGMLTQWLEKDVVVSHLTFRFDDSSLYDEMIRFSQRPVFRLLSYKLTQKGPSYAESQEVEFDSSGRYRARVRSADGKEDESSGKSDIPRDVSNGMTSVLLKNLQPGTSATTHLMAFTPKPQILELHLTPEGSDLYWVGSSSATATRYLIQPKVPGIKGAIATVIGKQPPEFRMWIADGKAPGMVRFEGPMYIDGPIWRIGMGAPTWKKDP